MSAENMPQAYLTDNNPSFRYNIFVKVSVMLKMIFKKFFIFIFEQFFKGQKAQNQQINSKTSENPKLYTF